MDSDDKIVKDSLSPLTKEINDEILSYVASEFLKIVKEELDPLYPKEYAVEVKKLYEDLLAKRDRGEY